MGTMRRGSALAVPSPPIRSNQRCGSAFDRSEQLIMIEVQRIALLPNDPAVYAMYGGQGRRRYVAYVGVADNLRRRVEQHLERRESSVTTGFPAVGLSPERVTELHWWTDRMFRKRPELEAAELIAFDILDPALRSRGKIQKKARQIAADPAFEVPVRALFTGPPTGRLVVPTLQDALDRIAALEEQVEHLSRRLEEIGR